ncbi:PEP-CTERM sorting domain-containing protein [Methylobacillus flagellatus]|uniref:Ice-binding protein C-terminal domain-containing protein n=1 Tax=Methylobacillus flagellatus (strain ATCC 51484 / DSM 6875 / VKM B-1610 / KT) TaxID=265072 RepID=Q1GYL4_METFK|nr:PEP-CTERM sorting domain-containing protein [Methylobacillus flagellatus]ABE50673.1 hypothetical protein Mfla_2408 [Methylobacillus flagellatus KT]
MNIKMKALVVAAVATMSISGAANAFDRGGDSSVFLTLLDRTNNISAVFDLGLNYHTFTPDVINTSGGFSWDLSAGEYADTWNTFFATADASSTKWAVAAFDNLGNNRVAGEFGFITTVRDGAALPDPMVTNVITQVTGPMNNYLVANERNGNVSTSGQGYAGYVYSGEHGSLWGRGPQSLAEFGAEQSLVQYLSGAGVIGRGSVVPYDEVVSIRLDANGALILAAVPEPETYALLLAGLGLVGVAARRRKSA